MLLHQVVRKIKALLGEKTSRNSDTRRQTSRQLEVEALEDRFVPATASGTITGFAFIDVNASGVRDTGDTLLPGVKIVLKGTTDVGDAVKVKVTTKADGSFKFDNVLPGQYNVKSGDLAFVNGKPVGVGPIDLDGGETEARDVKFKGISAAQLSLRQQLNSSGSGDSFNAAGSGIRLVNYRPNNTPTIVAGTDLTLNPAKNDSGDVIDLAGAFTDQDLTNSIVRFITSEGAINIELFDKTAPQTVANFFNYILSNRYDNTIFHRRETNFVLQGGGFRFDSNPSSLPEVVEDDPVANEFDGVNRSNILGTLAMAKTPGDPNSATSQFFFNLANNSSNLNNQNGGFTVFGRVASTLDRAIVNQIAAIPVRDFSNDNPNTTVDEDPDSPFKKVPIRPSYVETNFPTDTVKKDFAVLQDVKVIKRDEFLTYSIVTNSNPGLVTATIVNNRLKLEYADGQTGSAAITVRATDRFGATVNATYNITVENQAPTATVEATPVSPTVTDTINALVTTADPNGDAVTLTYRWLVNAVQQKETLNTPATTDSFILSDFGVVAGDQITLEVTPNDGTVDGTTVTKLFTVI